MLSLGNTPPEIVQPTAENGLRGNLEKLVVDFFMLSFQILSLLLKDVRSF